MYKFELIIFDCDGVLVDSEKITTKVFAKVLYEECGISMDLYEMYETFIGKSSQECLDIIEKILGAKPPSGLEARYQSEIRQALQKSVTAINGIEHALQNISTPYCVASAGSYEKMQLTLGKTNLLKYFKNKLFSTSDVPRGKPFPDIFLHAANSMNCTEPSKCLVIEDSLHGIKAGITAGMTVFAYSETMKEEKLIQAGAHHIIKNMHNLTEDIAGYERVGAVENH